MDTNETNDTFMPDVMTELLHYEVEADVLSLPADTVTVETPLAAADEEALEAGIAEMFESLLQSDAVYVEDEEIVEPADEEIEPTFALLDELNRIWAQPLAA
jgi:hypothetical protein